MHNDSARHFHFGRFIHSRYNDLVIADTLRNIALSMISVFIPIYLFDIGFSFREVLLYLFLSYAVQVISTSVVSANIFRWGVKRTLIISYLINVILYLALSSAESLSAEIPNPLFMLMIAVIAALEISFYWTAHHFYFLAVADGDNDGSRTGILAGIPVFFGIIGPLFGAYLITVSGFSLAFFVSTLLLIVASASLLFSREVKVEPQKISFHRSIDSKHPSKNAIYFLQGAKLVVFNISWPLIMYYLGISLLGIGAVYFLSNIIHSIFCYEAGRLSDRRGSRAVIEFGLFGHSLSLFARGVVATVSGAAIWTIIGGIFSALNAIPLEADFYHYAKKIRDTANANINREFYIILGKISIIIFYFVTYFYYSPLMTMRLSMFVAGIGTLAMIVLVSNNKDFIK